MSCFIFMWHALYLLNSTAVMTSGTVLMTQDIQAQASVTPLLQCCGERVPQQASAQWHHSLISAWVPLQVLSFRIWGFGITWESCKTQTSPAPVPPTYLCLPEASLWLSGPFLPPFPNCVVLLWVTEVHTGSRTLSSFRIKQDLKYM